MTIEELEVALLTLLKGKHSSLSISFNEDNGPNYQTVAEMVEQNDPKDHDWISEEEKHKAVLTNRMWEIQWYPDTPIGFCRLCASSLSAVIKAVLPAESKLE